MYIAKEDSFLLLEQVRKYAKGKVLDLGTGSAIQALGAADRKEVERVIAADIDKKVISELEKTIRNPKIKFMQSDLFSSIFSKFDTIIFNPPYLPIEEIDKKVKDLALYGGEKGHETIERFFKQVPGHLEKNGIILLVFSSLTCKEKVDEIIKENEFEFKELSKQHIFFEDLYVYLVNRAVK